MTRRVGDDIYDRQVTADGRLPFLLGRLHIRARPFPSSSSSLRRVVVQHRQKRSVCQNGHNRNRSSIVLILSSSSSSSLPVFSLHSAGRAIPPPVGRLFLINTMTSPTRGLLSYRPREMTERLAERAGSCEAAPKKN